MNPQARRDEILVEEVADELVIYDQKSQRAHRLNRTAALVWRHSDGSRSVSELAEVLRAELDEAVDEELVQVALDRLAAADLLIGVVRRSAEETRHTRRQVVRKMGRVGVLALLLPVVTTIVAPSAQAQASGALSSLCFSACACPSAPCLCPP